MFDLTDNPYIVADPRICHGKLTFRGTRVFVKDVLDMVADGMDWDTIIHEWHDSITREALAEAVRLASKSLLLAVPVSELAPIAP